MALMRLRNGETRELAICLHGPYYTVNGRLGYFEVVGESGERFKQRFKEIVQKEFVRKRLRGLAPKPTTQGLGP